MKAGELTMKKVKTRVYKIEDMQSDIVDVLHDQIFKDYQELINMPLFFAAVLDDFEILEPNVSRYNSVLELCFRFTITLFYKSGDSVQLDVQGIRTNLPHYIKNYNEYSDLSMEALEEVINRFDNEFTEEVKMEEEIAFTIEQGEETTDTSKPFYVYDQMEMVTRLFEAEYATRKTAKQSGADAVIQQLQELCAKTKSNPRFEGIHARFKSHELYSKYFLAMGCKLLPNFDIPLYQKQNKQGVSLFINPFFLVIVAGVKLEVIYNLQEDSTDLAIYKAKKAKFASLVPMLQATDLRRKIAE